MLKNDTPGGRAARSSSWVLPDTCCMQPKLPAPSDSDRRLLCKGLVLDKGRQLLSWNQQTQRLSLSLGMSEASRSGSGSIVRGASRQDWVRLQGLPGARFETSVLLKAMGGYTAQVHDIPLPAFLPPGSDLLPSGSDRLPSGSGLLEP